MRRMLEQSPDYQEAVKAVRKMPQETVEEAGEKRERAQLLRMETMLDNAVCAEAVVDELTQHPWVDKKYLAAYLKKTTRIIHPEVVSKFLDTLIETRKEVTRSLNFLAKEAGQHNETLGECFYRWILPRGETRRQEGPRGKVTVWSDYPLGIVVEVQDHEDFARIDPRRNVGGFYVKLRTVVATNTKKPGNVEYPVIAIFAPEEMNKREAGRIEYHEKGHAINRALQETFKGAHKKSVWAKFDQVPAETIKNLVAAFTKDPAEAKKSVAWQMVLNYALSRAKDELLAEFMGNEGNLGGQYRALAEKNGLYDYFKHILHIDTVSPRVYGELWSEYDEIVTNGYMRAQTIIDSYLRIPIKSAKGLSQRLRLFRIVLAQIPLPEWQRQLDGTLFSDEAMDLENISTLITQKERAGYTVGEIDAVNEFIDYIDDHPNRPWFKAIATLRQKLEAPAQPRVKAAA